MNKKQKKKKLNQILDMPREINKVDSKITVVSFDEILIEKYRWILEYEEFSIKVQTEIGSININGFSLELEQITEDDILIKGKINSIDLERITGWYCW